MKHKGNDKFGGTMRAAWQVKDKGCMTIKVRHHMNFFTRACPSFGVSKTVSMRTVSGPARLGREQKSFV